MTSWRDSASTTAQNDLDALLDISLRFAQEEIERRGEFFPFAAALTLQGGPEMIAARPAEGGERPDARDVIESCLATLIERRERFRAGAVIANVSLPAEGTDAIRVEVEHIEGLALTALLPYAKRGLRRSIVYGEIRAQAGHRRVWIGL